MAEDISITIKADPTQAVSGINQVKKAGDELADTSKKVSQSAVSDTSQTVNQVLSVGRSARREFEQTGTAVNSISSGIQTAAGEAAKVSGAFGQAVPVIGRLGSAIASAITGPVGAISAAIGLAIAGIQRMIADAEARVERLKLSAQARSSSAYDAIMKGRKDYADQLEVLAQVKEINKLAQESALSTNDLAAFRNLAAQIGIDQKNVTARGIKSGKLSAAERSINETRDFYSKQEYRDYVDEFQKSLLVQIGDSALSAGIKDKLLGMSHADRVNTITQAARLGQGGNTDEFKAWQDLYSNVKQYNEVAASFARDARLGRDQSAINAAAVDAIRGHAKPKGESVAVTGGTAEPGTWKWQQEQDRIEQERQDKLKSINRKLDEEQQIQQLINEGRQREAYILRNRLNTEAAIGHLTEAEARDLESRAGMLYDLQHPLEPDLTPEDRVSPVRTERRALNAPRLDRLQRIGANAPNAVTSPEKLVMDKQLSVQEDIRRILAATQLTHPDTSIMRF